MERDMYVSSTWSIIVAITLRLVYAVLMKPKRAIFEELLRAAGFKVTPQRIQLLEVLSKEERPLTVSELKEKLAGIDQVTIYRALEAMATKEIVRKVDTKHAYTHYELVATKAHHHHAICIVCGMVEDVELCLPPTLEQEVRKRLKHFSAISGHSLEFIGRCKQCIN